MLMKVHNEFNYCYFDTYGAVLLKYVAEVFSVEVSRNCKFIGIVLLDWLGNTKRKKKLRK